ncbi:hypothetical protein AQI95_42990 [Streptomyces yokosukanensis]|uniref:Uncharacterized protein n=1 Tax=Streptomyces yokosukanensis TaxID=67386 RepID=A0A124HCW9_9ACTN|nr:hypothetical protein AQI95_42990 [Streptomyces yokosukanensis]
MHELWPLAGDYRVRKFDGRLSLVVFLACIPMMVSSGSVSMSLMICSQAWVAWSMTSKLDIGLPRRLRWREIRWQRRHPQRQYLLQIALQQLFALICGAVISLANIELGVGVGLMLGLGSLAHPLLDEQFTVGGAKAMRPRTLIIGDAAFTFVRMLLVGLAMGTAMWLYRPSLGVVSGVVWALEMSAGASRRYLAFVLCARRDGILPLRLGSFLDWACEAGLLRLSGSAYQFRHRELQLWLATHSEPYPPGKGAWGGRASA